jgi:hypothetical protein
MMRARSTARCLFSGSGEPLERCSFFVGELTDAQWGWHGVLPEAEDSHLIVRHKERLMAYAWDAKL